MYGVSSTLLNLHSFNMEEICEKEPVHNLPFAARDYGTIEIINHTVRVR